MRTLKLLVALIVVAAAAACGSPDDDGRSLDTQEPPPTGEVQDTSLPTTSTNGTTSSGPVSPSTSTTVPEGSTTTGNPGTGSPTVLPGTTRTPQPGTTTGTTTAPGPTGAAPTSTTRVTTTTQPSRPTAAPSPTAATTAATPPKKAQTISFAQPPGPWAYGEPKTVVATASSDLSVSLNTTGACVVENALFGIVRANDVGVCRITASQNGDSVWKPADPVTRSITISKATPVITGFAGTTREHPRVPFSIPLNASASAGATVEYRVLPADDGYPSLCTVAGTELQVPRTQGLPQTCVVEAYVAESRLYVSASTVARFEITPTVVEFTDHTVVPNADYTVYTVSVSLNREWDIYVSASCGTPEGTTTGRDRYSFTLAVAEPVTAANPCTISFSISQIDGAHTSENPTLDVPLPPAPPPPP